MKQVLRTLATFFILPCAAATASLLIVFQLVVKPARMDQRDEFAWFQDALQLLTERHVDDLTTQQLVFEAIKGMAESADPYSDFIDPDEYARFREENEGQYVGIGFMVHNAGPPVTVLYPFENSPAKAAGLGPGDRIIAVDGEDCTGLTRDDVIGKIKLEDGEGHAVLLRVQPWFAPGSPAPEPFDVRVVRANIERDSVFDSRLVDREHGIGYVRIAAFQEHTAKELEHAIVTLSERAAAETEGSLQAVIIDLRKNRGGLLDQAVDVASLFLKRGQPVLFTEGRTQESNQEYDTNDAAGRFAHLKVAVLCDRSTASASEIVAGALSDHMRAVLVGDRTFGKGLVQSVIPRRYIIDDEERTALLKITTSRYVTPSGRAIERSSGLSPDVYARLPAEQDQLLERHFQDREVSAETWKIIKERTGVMPVDEGQFHDDVLDKAVEVLLGDKVFNRVS